MFEKLKLRRAFPVEGLEGVFVRLLDQGQKDRQLKMKHANDARRAQLMKAVESASDDEKPQAVREIESFENEGLFNYFTLGLIIVNSDGVQECPQIEGEDNETYARRVRAAMVAAEVDDAALALIGKAYKHLQTRGDIDPEKVSDQVSAIAKNS